MPLSLLQSIVHAVSFATKPSRQRRSAAGPRRREATVGLESLEQRMALTVAAPSIRLAAASDTGVRGDGITRLARPVFTGVAPARSNVVVYADGQLLGITTANVRGAWSLVTPAAKSLTAGAHTMTAYAVGAGQVWSTATPMWMAVDPAPPTASLTYDSVNGRATLIFSEPVSGVRAANLLLTGQTELGPLTSVSITDPRARTLVGSITVTPSENNTKFTFQEQFTLAVSGTYTLSFVKTGVVDYAGNPLAAGAVTSFRI